MKVTDLLNLKVGDYSIELIKSIQCESLESVTQGHAVLYILDSLYTEKFRNARNAEVIGNSAVRKKLALAEQMGPQTIIYAFNRIPTPPSKFIWHSFNERNICHLGLAGKSDFVRFIVQQLVCLGKILRYRRLFECVCIYNGTPATIFPAVLARFLLRKRLLVDIEDDYSVILAKSPIRKVVQRIVIRCADGLVAINRSVKEKYGEGKDVAVFNGQADFRYLKNKKLGDKKSLTLIYTGRLDDIGGALLIPDLIKALDSCCLSKRWFLFITGYGPRVDLAQQAAAHPSVEFLGFVGSHMYETLLSKADAAVVLQPPDITASRGTYPSKIMEYAARCIPVLALKGCGCMDTWNYPS